LLPPDVRCTIKSLVGWGGAPDPAGRSYSAPQTPYFRGLLLREGRRKKGKEGEGRRKGKEGKEKRVPSALPLHPSHYILHSSRLPPLYRVCVNHCYTVLPHHLSIFFLDFLFYLTPLLFKTPPVSASCHLAKTGIRDEMASGGLACSLREWALRGP